MADHYYVGFGDNYEMPGQGCFNEMEDVLVECSGGMRISGMMPPETLSNRILDRLSVRRHRTVEIPKPRVGGKQVLFIIGQNLQFVAQGIALAQAHPGRFDLVVAYVFDLFEMEETRASLRAARGLRRRMAGLHVLFSPIATTNAIFEEICDIPTRTIPMAADVLRFGYGGGVRPIDVNGYGRQHPGHDRILADRYNSPDSQYWYHHTSFYGRVFVRNHDDQRRLFWKTLTHSKLMLAYDPAQVGRVGHFPCSFVSQRWFEGLAAGCLVVGRRPTCPEVDNLLDWEDSTIEAPENANEFIEFIEFLLANPGRLEAASYRNYGSMLERHDWAHRMADMLGHLRLDIPDLLRARLSKLTSRKDEVGHGRLLR